MSHITSCTNVKYYVGSLEYYILNVNFELDAIRASVRARLVRALQRRRI